MKGKLLSSFLFAALILAVASNATASTIWYVNGVSGSDSNTCTSATTPCKTIGHAISLASSGDSIMIAAATYTENLTISNSLRILGSGATTTIIDGGGVRSVAAIKAGSQVTLSNMTIENGGACHSGNTDGGGIQNYGRLSIYNAVISGNSAAASGGGIYNAGTLKTTRTTINTNSSGGFSCGGLSLAGGGIYNSGTLTLIGSTVNGNSAEPFCVLKCPGESASGGGIYNTGTLTVINSTVTGNWASVGNQPLSAAAGGGIDSPSGTVTISNSTVSGNFVSAATSLAGGGILGSATLQNTIIAYNSRGNSYENCSGTMTSNGYNLSSDSSCSFTGPGDLNNTDPMLGPLQNNGGPTLTMALPSGSPAIDAGNPSGCADGQGNLLKTDQRGALRPNKEDTGGCDMGAFERQSD